VYSGIVCSAFCRCSIVNRAPRIIRAGQDDHSQTFGVLDFVCSNRWRLNHFQLR
jgi:hypothetical protein